MARALRRGATRFLPRLPRARLGENSSMQGSARQAFVAAVVFVGVVVAVLALWKLRLLLALLFLAFIVAATMRPSVEALRRYRTPRSAAILLHYAALTALVALLLWLVVPRAIDQIQAATSSSRIATEARETTGVKHDILVGLQGRLEEIPSGAE
jgi:predicted PurR-regulated permease PerM